jgi:hypothetical protein
VDPPIPGIMSRGSPLVSLGVTIQLTVVRWDIPLLPELPEEGWLRH